MSTSFIEYQGHGFWSFDPYMEALIAQVADLISETNAEQWEAELADHWKEQASGVFRAWMHLKLDEFLVDDQRRQRLIELVTKAAQEYPPTDPVHETAVLLIKLVNGELQWDASTPLDYMVGSRRPQVGN